MNHLERMQQRLAKHAEKKKAKRGRPPKAIVVPPPPPAPARQVVKALDDELPEKLILNGGQNLDVGDVFWHKRKFVIKKITKTVGSNSVEVEAECVKREWSHHYPTL
jgi:DNA invertase Pin-like site-specific DNA recombinase